MGLVIATVLAHASAAQANPVAQTPTAATPVPTVQATVPSPLGAGTTVGSGTASSQGGSIGAGGTVLLSGQVPEGAGPTSQDQGSDGSDIGADTTSTSAGVAIAASAPARPAGPPSLVVCESVGTVTADCHSEPLGAVGEGGFTPLEGQVPPVAEVAPAAAAVAAPTPYVPSAAEIQATILAAHSAVAFPDLNLQTAPPGDLDAPFITQLATFLWVDSAQWQPITATAEIPGYLVVTATAEPSTMLWSGGETGPIACFPPGIEWYAGAPEECTMTYKTSSATNAHELRLTVDWTVSFTCSAYCTGGTLPTVTHEYARSVRVAEIQSIVTAGG